MMERVAITLLLPRERIKVYGRIYEKYSGINQQEMNVVTLTWKTDFHQENILKAGTSTCSNSILYPSFTTELYGT